MLAKFAEDDRIEQMNAQKRRMKQLEHQRSVEKLLQDRRAQFAREREQVCYSLIIMCGRVPGSSIRIKNRGNNSLVYVCVVFINIC